MSLTSNVDAVIASLEQFVRSFDFTRPGKDQSLARDVVNTIAGGIQRRSIDEHKGATKTWPDNAPKYARYKEKKYGVYDAPNVRTGQMLSLQSLRGTSTRIEKDRIEMVYGTGDPPSATATGAPLSSQDEKVTDREKAGFAHEGGRSANGRYRASRPFYEADDPIAGKVREVLVENLNEYIVDTNAATAAARGGAP